MLINRTYPNKNVTQQIENIFDNTIIKYFLRKSSCFLEENDLEEIFW